MKRNILALFIAAVSLSGSCLAGNYECMRFASMITGTKEHIEEVNEQLEAATTDAMQEKLQAKLKELKEDLSDLRQEFKYTWGCQKRGW